MWLKIAGSLFVIMAGAYAGFRMASRCRERPRQIGQILACLAALKSYINYVAMPLPEALRLCANGVKGPVADLFMDASVSLSKGEWCTPGQAIEKAFDKQRSRLALELPEEEILTVLGANLGLVNREEQYKYIGVIEAQLQKLEREASLLRDRNARMYQYLGVCGSLGIVILLI